MSSPEDRDIEPFDWFSRFFGSGGSSREPADGFHKVFAKDSRMALSGFPFHNDNCFWLKSKHRIVSECIINVFSKLIGII